MAKRRNLGPRITAARDAINSAGGPAGFARKLSRYLGTEIDVKRIEQWRYRGVPDEWSVIVEHITGIRREKLNPHLYNVQIAHRVINRKLTGKKSEASAT